MTCEVAPHHLFLTRDSTILNSAVRPSLGAEEDRQFLWDNLQYIDIFATDHGKSLFAGVSVNIILLCSYNLDKFNDWSIVYYLLAA